MKTRTALVLALVGFVGGIWVGANNPEVLDGFSEAELPELLDPSERVAVTNLHFENEREFCATVANSSPEPIGKVSFKVYIRQKGRSSYHLHDIGTFISDFILKSKEKGTYCLSKNSGNPYKMEIDGEYKSIKPYIDSGNYVMEAWFISAEYFNREIYD